MCEYICIYVSVYVTVFVCECVCVCVISVVSIDYSTACLFCADTIVMHTCLSKHVLWCDDATEEPAMRQ